MTRRRLVLAALLALTAIALAFVALTLHGIGDME